MNGPGKPRVILGSRLKTKALVLIGLGLVGGAGATWANPADDLRDAHDRLLRSGNYQWVQKREFETNRGKLVPLTPAATGETIVGGYTSGKIRRLSFVMIDREIAMRMETGWKHLADVTAEDRAVAKAGGFPIPMHAKYVHPLPHEVLGLVMAAITNVRKQGPALVGDVDVAKLDIFSIEKYLSLGAVPASRNPANPFGMPLPRIKSAPRPIGHAVLAVCIVGGEIESIAIELGAPNRPGSDLPDERKWAHRFELSKIGTTQVDVPPEAKALFLGKSGR